jgi:hypothetical protein
MEETMTENRRRLTLKTLTFELTLESPYEDYEQLIMIMGAAFDSLDLLGRPPLPPPPERQSQEASG